MHQQSLAPYLAGLDDADAGFSVPNEGKRTVRWTAAVSAAPTGADTTLVTVAVANDATPTLDYLAVPATRLRSGELAVASFPALVGPPRRSRSAGTNAQRSSSVVNYVSGVPARESTEPPG